MARRLQSEELGRDLYTGGMEAEQGGYWLSGSLKPGWLWLAVLRFQFCNFEAFTGLDLGLLVEAPGHLRPFSLRPSLVNWFNTITSPSQGKAPGCLGRRSDSAGRVCVCVSVHLCTGMCVWEVCVCIGVGVFWCVCCSMLIVWLGYIPRPPCSHSPWGDHLSHVWTSPANVRVPSVISGYHSWRASGG